ncbi:MAG: hypothetical protein ACKVYV_14695, partial [Limisphaerales bacterium]
DHPGTFAFNVQFNVPVHQVSIDVGDFNVDRDLAVLTALDASLQIVDSVFFSNPPQRVAGTTLTVSSAQPITSVLFYDAGAIPGSVFWDNLSYTAVPEPVSAPVLALAAVGLWALRRHSRLASAPVASA